MDNNEAAQHLLNILYTIALYLNYARNLAIMIVEEGRRHRQMILDAAYQTTDAFIQLNRQVLLPHVSRSCWMRVRSKDWWERVVLKEFTDSEWKENFRMSRSSFNRLCTLMQDVMRPNDLTVRAPIPLQMRVAIVLYKLASCAEYRLIANQFGVHKSTVKKFVYAFCKGMVATIIHQLIKVPTAEEASAIARRFEEKFLIPQIIGCIDGTHIPLLPPSDGYKDFVNRKGWPSYVLQAVVDDMYRFWNINCQMPGCAHDANVLRQSALFTAAHQLPKEPRDINGTSINLFLLADPAYPFMTWLMKGYTHSPRLTAEQESFNVYLSSARTTVEIAFGRLKSRWRVLMKRSDFHFTFTPHVIATCCALHNFCELQKETVNPVWIDEADRLGHQLPQPIARAHNAPEDSSAQAVRHALTDYMAANFPLRRPLF
ncbi:putative nuclease HARBI1 [Neoarius graeffei]|uniref:putative nuclease HARBI1 n=1 Tax=Neoarius graeffei TaxID=443677 RepID=UPI00298C8594|nr:putative nuclease HARBI1 [Neoarius graeffei]